MDELDRKSTIQERLSQARRRARRRRILRLLLLFFLIAVMGALYCLLHQPGLSLGTVNVHGNTRITREEILLASGIAPGEAVNFFRVSGDRLQKNLANDVRVAEVRTEYHFPLTFDVYVTERVGIMCVRCAYGGFVTLDGHGIVMSASNGIIDGSVPFLTGFTAGNVYLGDCVGDKPVSQILKFMTGISADARSLISEVALEPDAHVEIRLAYGFPVRLGHIDYVDEKAKIFMTVFQEIRDKNVKAAYIDLQFSKPFIKLLSLRYRLPDVG